VSPDPPWRLLGGLGRRKYRPPPRGSQAQETAGTAGTLRQRLASPGGLGGGGHPRRRREAPPMASPPRAPSGAVTSPPRRRDRPHRGYVSPSSAQPRGARTSEGRGGGAGPGRARSGRRALRLSRLPLTRPGVRPRRLRSGPDKSSPARVRVRPPGSPCLRRLARPALPARCPRLSEWASVNRRGPNGGRGEAPCPAGPGSGEEPGGAAARGHSRNGALEGLHLRRPDLAGAPAEAVESDVERRGRDTRPPGQGGVRGARRSRGALVGDGPGLRARCGLASPSSRPCPGREAWRASGRA
jgi:hypothetical protein